MSKDKRSISMVWSAVSNAADDGSMCGRQDYRSTDTWGTGEMEFTIHGVAYRVVVKRTPALEDTTDE